MAYVAVSSGAPRENRYKSAAALCTKGPGFDSQFRGRMCICFPVPFASASFFQFLHFKLDVLRGTAIPELTISMFFALSQNY